MKNFIFCAMNVVSTGIKEINSHATLPETN